MEDYRTSLQTECEDAAAAAGIAWEEYVADTYRVAADNAAAELDAVALRCAREGLAIQAIANAEGISVSDEEIDQVVSEYVAAGNAEEGLNKDIVRGNLLYIKVYDFLMEIYGA